MKHEHRPAFPDIDRILWEAVMRGPALIPERDRRQIADIAVWKALDTFDPERGVKLSTYAFNICLRAMYDALPDYTTVRVPRTTFRRFAAEEMTPERAARVRDAMSYDFTAFDDREERPDPYDGFEAGDGDDPTEGTGGGSRGYVDPWAVAPEEAVQMLDDGAQRLVRGLMAGLTLEQIAATEGVSRRTVSRRLETALNTLRNILEESA